MKLSVIVPAYNEEECLEKTLKSIFLFLDNFGLTAGYEVIAVNDGSTDQTAEILKKISRTNFKAVNLPANIGKGGAVKAGMLAATGELKLFMDADGSTDISEIKKFLLRINEGYDIIIASRSADGAQVLVHQPFWKEVLGKLGNKIIRLITGLNFKDSQCGFKMFNSPAAELFKNLKNYQWAFDVEILLKARKNQLRVYEQPIAWTNNFRSHFTLKNYFKFFIDLVKICFTK